MTSPLGIFGGTFDPVHYGHLRPIRELRQQFPALSVRYIPLNAPPHRPPPLASAEQRLHMLRLAQTEFPEIEIDMRELERPGVSYTVDTLESLRPETSAALWVIVGADALSGMAQWHRFDDIMTLAHIIVLHRPGSAQSMPAWAGKRVPASAAELNRGAGGVWPVAVMPQPISATTIRERIEHGQPAGDLLPRAVWQYIQEQQLYFPQRRKESNAE